MNPPQWRPALDAAHRAAVEWLESVATRPINPSQDLSLAQEVFAAPFPSGGTNPESVIAELVAMADPGLLAVNSPRFHGWVNGGATPAGIAADWLVAAWDQNTAMSEPIPALGAVENITARWVLELLDLPADCGVGFVTGGQVANLVCLAAARSAVSQAYGWDVDANGMAGGPGISVVVGEHAHSTLFKALRILGFGHSTAVTVPTDENARIDGDRLADTLVGIEGPVIVCAQAGDVNTGGIDRFNDLADAVERASAVRPDGGIWLHVDGAVGLWGLASPALRTRFAGIERADSWSTDAHKWLNTPYDCGIAITAHPDAHRRAMALRADYLPEGDKDRTPIDWNPEMSRRARATPVYATMRSLGRDGITEMLERTAAMARLYGDLLGDIDGVEVLNEIELNQVLVRFRDRNGSAIAHTPAVLAGVQESGLAYPSPTVWAGEPAMRISVCNWMTTESDVKTTVATITDVHDRLRQVS